MSTDSSRLAAHSALLELLDDTQPGVRRALLAHFEKQGPQAKDFLQGVAIGSNRVLAWHARWFLDELRFTDPLAEAKGFIRSLSHDLEAGALVLCRVRNPQVDDQYCVEELDRLARRCRELFIEPMTVREKCRVINRVLFHEEGFRGNREQFSDPLNSFLDQVLARRTGLPLTLCLVYLLVCRRLGLPLEPVGLPGHFVVGCFVDGPLYFIDPFERGRFFLADEVSSVIKHQPIGGQPLSLSPTPVREMLCRCCRNLVLHYAAHGTNDQSKIFAELVEEFETTYERNPS